MLIGGRRTRKKPAVANEIAKVGFEADTSGIKQAKTDLEALVPAGEKVERTAKKVVDAVKEVGSKASQAAAGIRDTKQAAAEAAAAGENLARTTAAVTAAINGRINADRETIRTAFEAAKGEYGRARAVQATVAATEGATRADLAAADAMVKKASAALAVARIAETQSAAAENASKREAAAAAAAEAAAGKMERMGQAANDNLNRVQATPANIAAQFQDIGVTAAGGMSPLLIGLQQGTQLSAAFAGGAGLGALKAALVQVFNPVSLLTIGVVALAAAGIQLAMSFFESGNEAKKMSENLDKVKFASDRVHDSQNILASVFDETTGKLKTQNKALLANAEAQLMVARVKAKLAADEAKGVIDKEGSRRDYTLQMLQQPQSMGGGASRNLVRQDAVSAVMQAFSRGEASAKVTLKQLDMFERSGIIKADRFAELASAVTNYDMNVLNEKGYNEDLKNLEKGQLSPELIKQRKERKSKSASTKKTPEEKFQDVLTNADQRIAVMQAENTLIGKKGEALDSAKFYQELYNKAQDSGIKVGAVEIGQLRERADKMAAIAREGAYLKLIDTLTTGNDERITAIKAETAQIGLQGKALYFARAQAEGLAAAKAAGQNPDKDPKLMALINAGANEQSDAKVEQDRTKFINDMTNATNKRIDAIKAETTQLKLQGDVLAYAKVEARLLAEAKAAGQNPDKDPKLMALIGDQALAESSAQINFDKTQQKIEQQKKLIEGYKGIAKSFFREFTDSLREGKNLWDAFGDAAANALNKIVDKLMDKAFDMFWDYITKGGGSGGDGGAGSTLATLFSANGNAFGAGGNLMRYANGGVVNSPTGFSYAGGKGVMGEAGPEAIMPLKRGNDGKLGVQMHGGSQGSGSIVAPINITNNHTVSGAISSDDVVNMQKRSAEQTKQQLRREVPMIIAQYRRDGSLV